MTAAAVGSLGKLPNDGFSVSAPDGIDDRIFFASSHRYLVVIAASEANLSGHVGGATGLGVARLSSICFLCIGKKAQYCTGSSSLARGMARFSAASVVTQIGHEAGGITVYGQRPGPPCETWL
ncbi:MAG: hypothetical protein ACU0DJ_14105 [Paracoccus sp. (in: a-proteobacteria)]